MIHRILLLAALLGYLAAADQADGDWLSVTSWPIAGIEDERLSVSFRVEAGIAGALALAWDDLPAWTVAAPVGSNEGLLPLPAGVGLHRGSANLGGLKAVFAVRIVAVAGPWPALALRDGLPVDGDGVPVVLIDRRRIPNDLRRERLAPQATTRPSGRPIVVGDPLAALGGDAWQGLDAILLPSSGIRHPESAALVATAGASPPRSLIWSPGNQPLLDGTWHGEGWLCATLGRHYAALGQRPRLVVALPPLPVSSHLRTDAERRRRALSAAAMEAGWSILDLAAIAGDPATANRVADGLFTGYPVGTAGDRIRAALQDELRR